MNRLPVQSSNLKSVGYHDGTLELEFNTGRVYQYLDVSPQTYAELMHAESVGRYFTERIRDRYDHHEVAVPKSPDLAALVDSIVVRWMSEDFRGVYYDHAVRLYHLGITDLDILRALLETLYKAAADNHQWGIDL